MVGTASDGTWRIGRTHVRAWARRVSNLRPLACEVDTDRAVWCGLSAGVFNYSARHLGYPGQNPVSLLARTERPNSDEDEKPKRILTDDEQVRLLAAVEDRYRPLFLLAARTGLRLGEVLGLAWENIEAREEPTAGPAQAAQGQSDHALVFATATGAALDHRNIGGRVLARAVKKPGLGDVEVGGEIVAHAPTFHSLRHSFASFLIAEGFDVEEVSRALSHANPAVTQRIYVHQYDAAKKRDKMRGFLRSRFPVSVEDALCVVFR